MAKYSLEYGTEPRVRLLTVYYKQTADKTKQDLDDHRDKDVSYFLQFSLRCASVSYCSNSRVSPRWFETISSRPSSKL